MKILVFEKDESIYTIIIYKDDEITYSKDLPELVNLKGFILGIIRDEKINKILN